MPWIFQSLSLLLGNLGQTGHTPQEAPITLLMRIPQAERWTLHLATLNGKLLGDFLLVY